MNGKLIRSSLTLHDKINLLNDAKEGMSKTDLADKYKCDKSTVWRMIRNESTIREMTQNMNLKRKRNRKSIHQNIEEALNMWVSREKEQSRIITRELVLRKAQDIATRLRSDYIPTPTWIWRWSKRVNVKLSRPNKEKISASGDEGGEIESIVQCMQTGESDTQPLHDERTNVSVFKRSPEQFEDSFEEVLLHQQNDEDDMLFIGKTEITQPTKNYEESCTSNVHSRNARKHSWLSQLVLTQIEGIHPDDRGDFAWDVHKLIRKYQMKKKMRENNTPPSH